MGGGFPSLINPADLYGSDGEKITGMTSKTTSGSASSKVQVEDSHKNHAFPFVALIVALIAVRFFEALLPEG